MTKLHAGACMAVAALLAGCAGSSGTLASPGVAPADIPSLEQERAAHPADPALLTRLGAAYYSADRYNDARETLRASLSLNSRSYPATVYLGLAYEQLGELDSARAVFTRAGRLAMSSDQRKSLDGHLLLLTRKELVRDARTALAREDTLTASAPVPNTVAVLPFRYRGTNEDMRPLERGLSQLVLTDLGKVNQLRLLERERVQALVDEMRLGDSGRVEAASAARSGRLLRAERVVQGALQDPAAGQLRLDAAVVNAKSSSVVASGSAQDPLPQLFDMEKQVVMELLDRMGITLSPAERRAVSERPTADLQAFLAYSRGLVAEDRGDFAAAEEQYDAALARDPNFRAAREHKQHAQQLSSALNTAPPDLAGLGSRMPDEGLARSPGQVAVLRNLLANAIPSHGSQVTQRVATQPPVVRPPLPEALQQDDPRSAGLTGEVIIIITRP